jgi:hypothetical protein
VSVDRVPATAPGDPQVRGAGSQRRDALAWAAAVRGARHRTRLRLHRGEVTLAEVLDGAEQDPATGEQNLLWVLESLPGASKVATRRELAALAVDGHRAIGSLDAATRTLVEERFPMTPAGVTS